MRLVEIYSSIQGEGPNVGQPTTFVRFGGCNLRCPGWGKGTLPDGTIVEGCDTTFAVYPQWRDHWESIQPQYVMDNVRSDVRRVCLTGGEPLLQPGAELEELAKRLLEEGHYIDVFTNGSIAIDKVTSLYTGHSVTFVIDYKLPSSGEFGMFNQDNWTLLHNRGRIKDAVKFVCKDFSDFRFAVNVIQEHPNRTWIPYFGPVWGELDPKVLADWVVNEGPKDAVMQVQTHKYIWHPDERRV